jgi:chemosensory pili system protein ChpA (sensor histidine kinase/response regulator)
VEEVKTYIPSLIQGIDTLRQTPEQYHSVEEIHRLVHTIKGASSMVGIYGLSHIAYQMEEAISEILSGAIPINSETLDVMRFTVNQFQKYCDDLVSKGVNARAMLTETALAFRRLKNLPPEEDESALAQILENVPEYEGQSDAPQETGDTLPAELMERFYEEAEGCLSKLHQAVNAMEKPSGYEKNIVRIREALVTLRNAALTVRLADFAQWLQGLESFSDRLCTNISEITHDVVVLLRDSAEMIELLIANPEEAHSEEAMAMQEKFTPPPTLSRNGEEGGPISDEASGSEEDEPEILPELLESFYDEAKEHIEDLDGSLNLLESQIVEPVEMSSGQRETVRKIRRSVHTLKGAAAVIGLSNISSWAHRMEDFLDWLFETAQTINPEIVGVLVDSADLLERIIANPKNSQNYKAQAIQSLYNKIMGISPPEEAQQPEQQKPKKPDQQKLSQKDQKKLEEMLSPRILFSDLSEEEEESVGEPVQQQGRTLRVGMEKVDELVNLSGELFIALSAFDQKMELLSEAIAELDLSRNRLKDIARDMEVGYEVKALEQKLETAISGRDYAPVEKSPIDYIHQEDDEKFEDFDSLELDRYSELSLIIRMLNESAIDIGAIYSHLTNLFTDFDGHINRQRVLLSELQDKMMRVRMVPMAAITNKLRRIVRDVAGKLGKKIRLVISGAEIELDRVIWEKITDPLMHLLRNAADHGIEPPALRQTMGKPSVATIRLSASREGNQVVIRVTDDGSGLNYDAIRETARKAGLSDRIDEMSEEELTSLIFRPGFSTRGKISEVSGRGVGMDVIRENVQELKGTIRVSSWKGKGTQFTIRIPLTLAAVRALLLISGGQLFALALNEVSEIMRIDPVNITHEPEDTANIGNKVLPLYYLSKLLNMKHKEDSSEPVSSFEHPIVLVIHAGGRKAALIIDAIVGQREIVIKSTGTHLRHVKGISGATIMGDGSVVPILNLEELIWGKTVVPDTMFSSSGIEPEKVLEIMIVDDSVSIRQVVSRLIEEQGWKAHTAKDGLDALEKLREVRPDIIVLDIEMPRMNGYEFLSAIKADMTYQNIPVVMLTSRTTAKHREKALALGAKGFTIKPYNKDEFVNVILKLTDH